MFSSTILNLNIIKMLTSNISDLFSYPNPEKVKSSKMAHMKAYKLITQKTGYFKGQSHMIPVFDY
jgi:hypothetical protein